MHSLSEFNQTPSANSSIGLYQVLKLMPVSKSMRHGVIKTSPFLHYSASIGRDPHGCATEAAREVPAIGNHLPVTEVALPLGHILHPSQIGKFAVPVLIRECGISDWNAPIRLSDTTVISRCWGSVGGSSAAQQQSYSRCTHLVHPPACQRISLNRFADIYLAHVSGARNRRCYVGGEIRCRY